MAFPTPDGELTGSAQQPVDRDRRVAVWLLICAAMVLLIVLIGGVTRLTESGLSITEWRPVSGVLPPLSDAQWNDAFVKYQQTTEYRQLNSGMSLGEFKRIFFWEYLHRLWGRLVGLAVVLPLIFFAARGSINRALLPRLIGIVLLIGIQGALGWFMVQSGLSDRVDVSQYRLAAHLSLALVIYSLILWTGVSLLSDGRGRGSGIHDLSRPEVRDAAQRVRIVLVFVAATIVAGAFVAGVNGGRIYNTFPLMNGRVVPSEYLELTPWYLNFFENPAAIQFNHRLLGVVTVTLSMVLWFRTRTAAVPALARSALNGIAVVSALQFLLGIATLLSGASIGLAAAHQTGAVLLLTTTLLALRGLTPIRRPEGLYFPLHRRGVAPRV